MNSKKLFAHRSKRESLETHHRIGEVLPNDMSLSDKPSHTPEPQTAPNAGRRRLPNLKIVPPDSRQLTLSPVSSQHDVALVNSASCMQAVFSGMLRSPMSTTMVYPDSASTYNPVPVLPLAISLPHIPDLPVELPESIFLDDQRLLPHPSLKLSTSTRPVSHKFRLETLPFEESPMDHGDLSALLHLFPQPRRLAESSPERNDQAGTMRSLCSSSSSVFDSNATAGPVPLKMQQKQCASEINSQKHSRQGLMKSPSFLDMKNPLSICGEKDLNSSKDQVGASRLTQPSPMDMENNTWKSNVEHRDFHHQDTGISTPTLKSHSKQIEALQATISTQDQTIFTLQAQFGSLRASHEAHIASFAEMQAAEVASLKNYARVLEEQLSQRPSLHHASNTDLLILLETVEPHTPACKSSRHNPATGTAISIQSFPNALNQRQQEQQKQQVSQGSQTNPEMENLKRRLSTSRRPETTNQSLLPELNQYKQNNVALQKQIESLMAKLNDSKKREKVLRESLEDCEYRCTQWQDQAVRADKIAKSAKAMQNTINNLEKRLEIANIDKLDVEEQLFNLRAQQSSCGTGTPRLQDSSVTDGGDTKDTHMSMNSVSSTEAHDNSQESVTLDILIAHIERLEDIIRQQDAHISGLEGDVEEMRQRYGQLEQENSAINLQLDIQNELMMKTEQTDMHIEQLRTAVVDRESIIEEKEKSIRLVERQLEHHKLLLQAEIRKHAKMTLHAAINDEPLPELSTLADKEEVDKWIDKLHQRLKKEKPLIRRPVPTNALEAQVDDLRQEVDFYVREIIYYKLDIRGYKSDIKKLKRITTQLSTYGSRASDLESDTSSLRPAPTPSLLRFPPVSDVSSSAPSGYFPPFAPREYPVTPPLSASTFNSSRSMNQKKPTGRHTSQPLDPKGLSGPRTPHRRTVLNTAGGSRNSDAGISPRSVAKLSPERRKPTPSSLNREKFGNMLTNFHLSTPASPKRCDAERDMSDSAVRLDTRSDTVKMGPAGEEETSNMNMHPTEEQRRVASSASLQKASVVPECPPRLQDGVFDSPPATHQVADLELSTSPRVDMVPDTIQKATNKTSQSTIDHSLSTSSTEDSLAKNAKKLSAISTIPSQPLQRTCSVTSNSTMPFVTATSSPHNLALNHVAPTTTLDRPTCSITRNFAIARTCAALKNTPLNSGIRVGETTATTTTHISLIETRLPEEEMTGGLELDFPIGGAPRTPNRISKGSVESVVTTIKIPERESAVEGEERHAGGGEGDASLLGSPFVEREKDLGRRVDVGSDLCATAMRRTKVKGNEEEATEKILRPTKPTIM